MRLGGALALLLVAAAFSGCIGGGEDVESTERPAEAGTDAMAQRAGVDQLPAELGEIVTFETAAEDGTALRGHVYLPEGHGPFATVLLYYPYWNEGGGLDSDGMATEKDGRRTLVEFHGLQALMDAGFAIAAINLRGSGMSDGCYEYMDHTDNGPDANAVIDGIAGEPWSDGNVGMYGISYGGATQYAALASDTSEHLKATVPVSGEWDEWNLLGYWGAPTWWSAFHPTYRHSLQGLGLGGFLTDPQEYQPTPEKVCEETVDHTVQWENYPVTGDKDAFLQTYDLRDGLRESDVPIFATNGMTDGEGHILQFEGLWDIIPHDQKRLMVGQWPHAFPFEDDVAFTEDHVVPWFDHHLRGGPAVEMGTVTYEDDTGTVHQSTAWPPAETNLTRLFLSDGTLVERADQVQASEQATLANDATEAFPDDCPGDEAVWISPPLAQDTLIAGNLFVNLTLTSTEPNENLVATLWTADELPACEPGKFTDEPEGVTEHRYAISDLRHRGHLEQGEPFPVGEPGQVELRSIPLAEVLPAGERIVLTVKGGHPSLVPRPGVPTLTFHTGPDVLAELWLPVVGGELAFQSSGAEAGPGMAEPVTDQPMGVGS